MYNNTNIKILVIDDEAAIRQSFADYLEDREYQVITAENGRIGLELMERDQPQIVLVDLRMPEIDGLEVLRLGNQLAPDIPKIVISGANRIDDVVRALQLGAWDYLIKPIKDLSILGHAVDKAQEKARLLRENLAYQEHLEVLVRERTSKLELAFESLQKSEKQYRTLFEKTNDAIFIVQKSTGQYLDANKAATELTGRTLAELKQLTIRDVTTDETREWFREIADTNEVEELRQVTYHRPDSIQRIARLSIVPMDDEAVIGIARDITHDMEIETQLRQSQKMEAIGTLAGGIAHDFNNILSAILGYSELGLINLDPENPLRNRLEAIYRSGERARELVSQILAFSRSEEQVTSPVRVDLILKEALKLLRPAIPSTINIRQRIDTKGKILGDPTRIHQIIMNLCTNAYQAMYSTGGILDLSLVLVELVGHAAAAVQLPPGSYIKLTVSDTGCGIPSEYLDRIFDPYFTTKEKDKGTGLGLAVVHGIVKNHGGTVTVNSKVDTGTEFEVYLPLAIVGTNNMDASQPLMPGGNESILLVDDERDIVIIEKEMLEKLGYRVITTDKADEVITIYTSSPERFDLVITDMTMPNMTGIRLAEKLKVVNPEVRIVICSGYNETISHENYRDLGIDGYIPKPVTFSELAVTVRKVLDENKG